MTNGIRSRAELEALLKTLEQKDDVEQNRDTQMLARALVKWALGDDDALRTMDLVLHIPADVRGDLFP